VKNEKLIPWHNIVDW